MGRWLVWDGRRWHIDDMGAVTELMRETVRAIYDEVKDEATDVEAKKRLVAWAVKSGSGPRISEALRLAKSDPHVVIEADALDANPWLLNVLNGTLDLKAGELRPHNRADLNTRLAPVAYDPDAKAPLWEKFLARIFADNANLVDFHQRAVGYSLTGDASERALFIQYGRGKNGKSTFLSAIRAVLGDYAGEAPVEMLLAKRGDPGVPNDVARLPGTRFVSAKETEEGKRLAEARVKDLIGNEPISARFMHGEWFDFRPQFKLWLATNHKPDIRGTDDGIWDRIRLLPYKVRIPEGERVSSSIRYGPFRCSGVAHLPASL